MSALYSMLREIQGCKVQDDNGVKYTIVDMINFGEVRIGLAQASGDVKYVGCKEFNSMASIG